MTEIKKIVCDKCQGEVEKLPSVIIANKRTMDLCNKCWGEFVKFIGKPFYTNPSLPENKINQKGAND